MRKVWVAETLFGTFEGPGRARRIRSILGKGVRARREYRSK